MNKEIYSIYSGMHLKLIILVCLYFGNYYSAIATEMEICPGVTGIWLQLNEHETPSFSWQAQWIWMDEAIESDVMLTRKSFELTASPKETVLRITATSKYQL